MGPWCLPAPESSDTRQSLDFFLRRFAIITMPCSVPTRYLEGPASMLYSIEEPPRIVPLPLSSDSWSVGSPSRRVSHHNICPSVDTLAHMLCVLEEIQNTSYTGSWCEFSIRDVSSGCPPLLRRSKKDTSPLYEPPTSVSGVLGLKRRHTSGEAGTSSVSGVLGFMMSQMYDFTGRRCVSIFSSWNVSTEYETAMRLPSGCQLMLVAVRFVAFGSRKTARPLADGGSLLWSVTVPTK
mmetsp:Transcript_14748/g.51350  ORF Transcript_14748/g.51350 Transcript_14748/m.51350 type:complete len:237 (-) Transcript_14748:619-1329(-)